jgi:hypothetical protein
LHVIICGKASSPTLTLNWWLIKNTEHYPQGRLQLPQEARQEQCSFHSACYHEQESWWLWWWTKGIF